METISVSEFNARCLAILDHVRTTGERVLILKRGRPVAELLPTGADQDEYPQLELAGTLTIVDDIIGPAVPEQDWEILRQ
ncbi:MAG: type II toxin-antitoxin system Phd/YefM family antitoxin [Candidatus Aminicenantes bacterium]|nr:type II toxin-antitoxin system Phd/YefM family antitoxin [Candidatus Aminicenantes bacterium]